jgi:hypothetical protein
MNNFDPVEMLKNAGRNNTESWLRETSIVSYGVVLEVINDGAVKVEQIVRNSSAKRTLLVPILSVGSSLFEQAAVPSKGDLVLLLFVDLFNRSMFSSPQQREKNTGEFGIQDETATGYNKFSGVGILLAPFTGSAETSARFSRESGVPTVTKRSRAKWTKIFRREMTTIFDALPGDGAFIDRLVRTTFGQHSPHLVEHWAAVTRRYGFAVKEDKSLETVVAPVVEEYSTMAPITKNIQGTQTVTIGKGTSPAGDPAGSPVDTTATITVTIGADADATITSESSLTVVFKGMELSSTDVISMMAGTAKLIKIGNNISTLGPLISELVAAINTTPLVLVTGATGSPSPVNPAVTTALAAFKTKWEQVFE